MKIIVKTTLKINIENQHRKSTLKINIENTTLKLTKKNVTSTWPVVIIDQDALHAYSTYFIHKRGKYIRVVWTILHI